MLKIDWEDLLGKISRVSDDNGSTIITPLDNFFMLSFLRLRKLGKRGVEGRYTYLKDVVCLADE